MTAMGSERTGPDVDPGDLGRRVRERRERLGLPLAELARRAGMAPGYLEYVESRPGANPGAAAIARLAAALETTSAALRGGGASASVQEARGRGRDYGWPAHMPHRRRALIVQPLDARGRATLTSWQTCGGRTCSIRIVG